MIALPFFYQFFSPMAKIKDEAPVGSLEMIEPQRARLSLKLILLFCVVRDVDYDL